MVAQGVMGCPYSVPDKPKHLVNLSVKMYSNRRLLGHRALGQVPGAKCPVSAGTSDSTAGVRIRWLHCMYLKVFEYVGLTA